MEPELIRATGLIDGSDGRMVREGDSDTIREGEPRKGRGGLEWKEGLGNLRCGINRWSQCRRFKKGEREGGRSFVGRSIGPSSFRVSRASDPRHLLSLPSHHFLLSSPSPSFDLPPLPSILFLPLLVC